MIRAVRKPTATGLGIVRRATGGRKPAALFATCLLMLVGCAAKPTAPPDAPRRVIVVPGVGGWGNDYAHFVDGLRAGGVRDVDSYSWGSPIFLLNFQDRAIHDQAETGLADRLNELQRQSPHVHVDLVGHSAGCGVILGALAKLKGDQRVGDVVLLAPSVSPTYDLTPAMRHVDGRLHVFYSDRDQLFLNWRTSTFGTYDSVKTKAAGHVGFDVPATVPRDRIVQHPYDPAWASLGNDGGHMGTLAAPFAQHVVAPLLVSNESIDRGRQLDH